MFLGLCQKKNLLFPRNELPTRAKSDVQRWDIGEGWNFEGPEHWMVKSRSLPLVDAVCDGHAICAVLPHHVQIWMVSHCLFALSPLVQDLPTYPPLLSKLFLSLTFHPSLPLSVSSVWCPGLHLMTRRRAQYSIRPEYSIPPQYSIRSQSPYCLLQCIATHLYSYYKGITTPCELQV